MRLIYRTGLFIGLLGLLIGPAAMAQQTAVLSGTVTDAGDGEPLIGTNVVLSREGEAGIVGGSATGAAGQYEIRDIPPGSYIVTFRFIGYNEQTQPVTLAAGETATVDATLTQGGLDLNTVIITASRQAEKVLDAPASITVLDAREVQQDVDPSSVAVLRNTTGVDMAQTGVDRREVVLRGFNNAFSSAAYVLTDYRQAALPSLNANIFSIMPNMAIDIERVEVVRGPGSALYGAGVDEGVVHFITKDPFSYPGTTVSVFGGERSMFGAQLRHAGTAGDNVGYKITGFYTRADDWELDPNDPDDAFQLGLDAEGLERDYGFEKYNVNGTLQYRFNDQVNLIFNGGHSGLTGIVLSGIGTLQGDGFGYSYGQVRLQAPRFFTQFYVNRNSAGDSFVYGTGDTVVDHGTQYNAQAQYDLNLAGDRVRLILGADFELVRPDTEGSILGRNDNDDDISEVGGYVQSTFGMTDQLDLTIALRGDASNIFDFQVSPRAALVYKATPTHTLRASYNRSFSSPSSNSLFLDIVGQEQLFTPDPAGPRLLILGRGSRDGFTFSNFRTTNAARFFLPVPGFFGTEFNVDTLPLIPIYGAAASGLVEFLASEAPLPAGLPPLSAEQRGLLANLLGYTAQNGLLGPTAATGATQLGIPDDSEQGYRPVSGPIDIAPLEQTVTQTYEVGYKGLVGDRLVLAVDAYYANKKNFVGPLLVETPLVYMQQAGLSQDVGVALGQYLATAGGDPTIMSLLTGLQASGLDAATSTQILAGLVGGALANQPVAVVQSDQPVLQEGTTNAVGGFAAYRNFGNINYWGVDASARLLASDELTLFGNVSIMSDDFFDNEELDEEDVDLELALNAPAFKLKLGGDYAFPSGFSINASGRHTDGFPVRSGSDYIGRVESAFLVDLGAGYAFQGAAAGLRLDVTVQNLLNNEHRQFVGAPEIGRMTMARLLYTFP